MNFYRTELIYAALADELAEQYGDEVAEQYGDEVAHFIARQPDNQTTFAELARQLVGMVPESSIDEMFDANVATIDWILEAQYVITCPERAAAQLVARRLIRRKEVSHVAAPA